MFTNKKSKFLILYIENTNMHRIPNNAPSLLNKLLIIFGTLVLFRKVLSKDIFSVFLIIKALITLNRGIEPRTPVSTQPL